MGVYKVQCCIVSSWIVFLWIPERDALLRLSERHRQAPKTIVLPPLFLFSCGCYKAVVVQLPGLFAFHYRPQSYSAVSPDRTDFGLFTPPARRSVLSLMTRVLVRLRMS